MFSFFLFSPPKSVLLQELLMGNGHCKTLFFSVKLYIFSLTSLVKNLNLKKFLALKQDTNVENKYLVSLKLNCWHPDIAHVRRSEFTHWPTLFCSPCQYSFVRSCLRIQDVTIFVTDPDPERIVIRIRIQAKMIWIRIQAKED